LPFLDLVNEFNASNRDRRMIEALELEHGPYALLHPTVVLFDEVV
jgi:hypothetical protein